MSQHLPKRPADVVLCHFGGPTQESEVERFLYELFLDPLIIRAPLGPIRPWLARRIASKRWRHTNEQYKTIGYSPINAYTQAQADNLLNLANAKRPGSRVHVINRYTAPRATDVVRSIRWLDADVFIMTLYPHFCHSTTASAFADLDKALLAEYGHKDFPATRVYSWWFYERYFALTLQYLVRGIEEALAKNSHVDIVFAAHGIPMRYKMRGDPYTHEINTHFLRLQDAVLNHTKTHGLDWSQKLTWNLTFQSRVGRMEWVKPYTDEKIQQLGSVANKQKGILLVPISFVSDHIETIFEMDITYRELALNSGYKDYSRVALPNSQSDLTQSLFEILQTSGL
jgi:ferrochelatase